MASSRRILFYLNSFTVLYGYMLNLKMANMYIFGEIDQYRFRETQLRFIKCIKYQRMLCNVTVVLLFYVIKLE
jgi:hypothetical protein